MLAEGHVVELAASRVEIGRAALGSWGELIASSEMTARIETSMGGTLDFDEPVATQLRGSVLWLDEASGLFLVIPRQGELIVAFDLRREESWSVARLERFEERGFRWIRLRRTPAGGLLVLYEYGLLCLRADGRLLWHADHDDLTADFDTVDGAHVVIRSQFPESTDRVSKYSMKDGRFLYT